MPFLKLIHRIATILTPDQRSPSYETHSNWTGKFLLSFSAESQLNVVFLKKRWYSPHMFKCDIVLWGDTILDLRSFLTHKEHLFQKTRATREMAACYFHEYDKAIVCEQYVNDV